MEYMGKSNGFIKGFYRHEEEDKEEVGFYWG